jgi:hypothetical protein
VSQARVAGSFGAQAISRRSRPAAAAHAHAGDAGELPLDRRLPQSTGRPRQVELTAPAPSAPLSGNISAIAAAAPRFPSIWKIADGRKSSRSWSCVTQQRVDAVVGLTLRIYFCCWRLEPANDALFLAVDRRRLPLNTASGAAYANVDATAATDERVRAG